jgi:2-polyprenyl-3-methyl-5-hydroxy-6-metoxy-1,4-benzoquinol methylase
LYEAYVSSGHAGNANADEAEKLFRPRKAYLMNIIAKHFPADRSVRVLDLGCGHGAFLYFLSQAGYQDVCGIDISSEQIELAHRLGIDKARLGKLEDFLLEHGDGCVDVVLAMDILEHLTQQELFGALEGIRRVLKPHGSCIAHVPNAEGLYGMRIRYGDMTHEQAFTPGSARQIFRTVGFSEIQCYEDRPVVHGMTSLVRRILWDVGTLHDRMLLMAETGARAGVLSQNMIIKATL